MKEITVLGSPLVLKGGIVKLTEKQAAARKHCLKPVLDADKKPIEGCYEIIAETTFKVGEVLGYTVESVNNLRPDLVAQINLSDLNKRLEELTKYTLDLEAELAKKDAEIAELKAQLEEKKGKSGK
jgi:hypothetical protein